MPLDCTEGREDHVLLDRIAPEALGDGAARAGNGEARRRVRVRAERVLGREGQRACGDGRKQVGAGAADGPRLGNRAEPEHHRRRGHWRVVGTPDGSPHDTRPGKCQCDRGTRRRSAGLGCEAARNRCVERAEARRPGGADLERIAPRYDRTLVGTALQRERPRRARRCEERAAEVGTQAAEADGGRGNRRFAVAAEDAAVHDAVVRRQWSHGTHEIGRHVEIQDRIGLV